MKLETQFMKEPQTVEVGAGEFGTITLRVQSVSLLVPGQAQITLSQLDALALARIIEEQVKDIRRLR